MRRKLERLASGGTSARGIAYFVAVVKNDAEVARLEAMFTDAGLEVCSDGLDEHEVGLFLHVGKHEDEEARMRAVWAAFKANV